MVYRPQRDRSGRMLPKPQPGLVLRWMTAPSPHPRPTMPFKLNSVLSVPLGHLHLADSSN